MTERLLSCLLNKIQLNTKKRCGNFSATFS